MTPGIVGNECQRLILHGEFSLFVEVERLGVSPQCDYRRAGDLGFAQLELRFLVDEC